MRRRLLQTFGRREAVLYLSVALVTMAVTALALELWRMSPSVPLAYVGDALSTANYLDTIRETGWYESQSRLGAPFGLVYHDYPAADHLHLVIMGLIMAIVPKFGFAMNAYYLIGFPLAALTATWLFRTVGIGRVLSGALAVLFAIAPYHLRRGELHLFLSSYWPIPLFVVLVIRVLRGRGLWNRAEGRSGIGSFVTWQNAGTVAILLVAGSATQYYALFDVLLIGLAALMALVRDRSWRRLVGAIVAGATVAVVLLLNMLPDLLYSAANGPSYGAADRPAVHTEWFALKIALLFMPADTHRFAPFRELAAAYDKEFTQYTLTSVGIVAAIGLIVLLATLTAATLSFARRRSAHDRIDPARNLTAMLGGILLWILVIATSGGLSVFVALLVTTKVRGWDRISIYLVLLGLIAFGLAVQRWLRWLRRRSTGATRTVLTRFGAAIIAAIVLVVGYWDQTSPLIVPPYEQNLAEYTEDAAYASTLQAVLPAGSSVYQLPYQPFPEGPYIVNGMTDYDHVKLALFTDQLSFSYGGVKGRPTADWPIALQTASTKDMVGAVTAAGFAGLSIDRDGYADHGRVLESGALGSPRHRPDREPRRHVLVLGPLGIPRRAGGPARPGRGRDARLRHAASGHRVRSRSGDDGPRRVVVWPILARAGGQRHDRARIGRRHDALGPRQLLRRQHVRADRAAPRAPGRVDEDRDGRAGGDGRCPDDRGAAGRGAPAHPVCLDDRHGLRGHQPPGESGRLTRPPSARSGTGTRPSPVVTPDRSHRRCRSRCRSRCPRPSATRPRGRTALRPADR